MFIGLSGTLDLLVYGCQTLVPSPTVILKSELEEVVEVRIVSFLLKFLTVLLILYHLSFLLFIEVSGLSLFLQCHYSITNL